MGHENFLLVMDTRIGIELAEMLQSLTLILDGREVAFVQLKITCQKSVHMI